MEYHRQRRCRLIVRLSFIEQYMSLSLFRYTYNPSAYFFNNNMKTNNIVYIGTSDCVVSVIVESSRPYSTLRALRKFGFERDRKKGVMAWQFIYNG